MEKIVFYLLRNEREGNIDNGHIGNLLDKEFTLS